jgi:cyclase
VFAQEYYESGIDEVLLVDVVASLYSRKHLYNLISYITKKLRVPVTVVGGIKTMEDVDKLFSLGIEKICIQSKAIDDFGFLKLISDKYGSQAVVLSVDFKKNIFGKKNILNQ